MSSATEAAAIVAAAAATQNFTRTAIQQPVAVVQDLVKIHGRANSDLSVRALDGVSFNIHPGEYLAVTGESGSGKSTLLHLLAALDTPTRGEIMIAGQSTKALDNYQRAMLRARHIGIVFQGSNLIPSLTALENVLLAAHYANQDKRTAKADAIALLNAVGLDERSHHFPHQLSGGQQQRVAIARALINRPAILLADEPTGELDSRNAELVLRILENFHKQNGQTLIVSTHNSNIWARAKRVVRLQDGKVVENRTNRR